MIQNYSALISLCLLAIMIIIRTQIMRSHGIKAVVFGKTNATDFILIPVMLFFFYMVTANTFHLPVPFDGILNRPLFTFAPFQWLGVLLCFGADILFLICLISFGNSFRVGIDTEKPDKLVTGGIFSYSRNPIYTAFGSVFIGMFLIRPTLLYGIYLLVVLALLHRQVLREEAFLKQHYGEEYLAYCKKVRRYL